MSVRWECPNGKHPAVLAPERPRKNDVRRYCLRCSEVEGILVERTAPALERKRAAARATTAARSAKRKETERAETQARRIVKCKDANGVEHDLDVYKELTAALYATGWMGLRVYGTQKGYNSLADLGVNIRKGAKAHSTGRVWGNYTVAFTFGKGASYESNLELIYHEAAHLTCSSDEHHGTKFRRTLADALQSRWPFLVYGRVTTGAVYDADRRMVEQMKSHVLNGGEL